MASGKFTSLVGAGRSRAETPGCIADGRKPIQLQIRMKRNSGHAERDEALTLGADRRIREVAHLLDQDLPDELEFARHAVGDLPLMRKPRQSKMASGEHVESTMS